jgi:predicted GIY-YIG superfamily endonuclease
MGVLPIDYSRTIIYKLVCKDPTITDCYVGATTDFTQRRYRHKNNCINEKQKEYDFTVYRFIRANGGFANWDMIMVEEYSCENSIQSATRERYWLETLRATLNINVPNGISTTKHNYRMTYKNKQAVCNRKHYSYQCECKRLRAIDI